jgi:hypothetical protein
LTIDRTPGAIRMLDGLDREGRELFEEVSARGNWNDGYGETFMGKRIADRVPEPVALTYRQLVALSEDLVAQFVQESWDDSDHDAETCNVLGCEHCFSDWEPDAVRAYLLDELDRRRDAWFAESPSA